MSLGLPLSLSLSLLLSLSLASVLREVDLKVSNVIPQDAMVLNLQTLSEESTEGNPATLHNGTRQSQGAIVWASLGDPTPGGRVPSPG